MRMSFLIFLSLIIIFPSKSKCQGTLQNQNQFLDLAFSVKLNLTEFENSAFINSLKQADLPVALSNSIIGFGSDVYLSKLQPKTKLIPIIGVAVIKEKKSNGNISVNANVVSNTYSVHYLVSNSKRHYFYPGIGFGWTMYKLNFLNHENAPASYPDALQNFNGERTIQSADLTYLNFAANYDFQ